MKIKRLPVYILTGFLGSGKTTFLRYLLRNTKNRFAVIVNEFGEIGLDGQLVQNCNFCDVNHVNDYLIELNNGCICCTVQEDFLPTMKKLINISNKIDGIIIETSGLALPTPLIKALSWPDVRSSCYLDSVITLINGESFAKHNKPIESLKLHDQQKDNKYLEHYSSIEELFSNQLSASDVVIISRSDLINNHQFELIRENLITKLNRDIPVLKSYNGNSKLDFIFGSNLQSHDKSKTISEDHSHLKVYSESIRLEYFHNKKELDKLLPSLILDLEIIRLKGRCWIPGKNLPLQIQMVGSKINTWFEEASDECWKPSSGGGIDIVLITFQKNASHLLTKKIKEKFKVIY